MNKRSVLGVALSLMFGFSALHASAQKDPMVGGAAMYPTTNIVENAVNSKDHTTLVAGVTAAGGNRRRSVETGKPGPTEKDPHLPRGRRQDDLEGYREGDQGWWRKGSA